jgi:hypothetical protein
MVYEVLNMKLVTTFLPFSARRIRIALWLMHTFVLAVAVYYCPVNWDEGWTFCTARHLLEDNHYGCRYNGELTPTRLTTGLSTVLMAYGGFRLFGVSYIAGCLLFAAQALLLLLVYTYIVRKTWGENVELICLACLLMLSGDLSVHPMFLGAQA